MAEMTPTAPQRKFDQIVSADVKIQKICNSDHKYKITFVGNVSKVLMYQTWSSTSTAFNNDRIVLEIGAKEWVRGFFRKVENGNVPSGYNGTALLDPVICANGKKYSNSSFASCAGQKDCKPYVTFTPTCVMELEHDECPIHDHKNEKCRHVFVINNAKVNCNGRVVFYVSSENIDPGNKNKVINKIKKIPKGEFHNARFDIDTTPQMYAFLLMGRPGNGSNTVAGFITTSYNPQTNVYKLNFNNSEDAVQTVNIIFIGKTNLVFTTYAFPMKFSSEQDANNMLGTIYTTLNNTISDPTLLTYTPGSILEIIGQYPYVS